MSSDLSQTFASRLKLAGAVAIINGSGDDEDFDDDEKSSEVFGEVLANVDESKAAATTTTASATTTIGEVEGAMSAPAVTKVILPPGGLVEPPPPRLSMPPPKPLPPPTPRSVVVPAVEELSRIDAHVFKVRKDITNECMFLHILYFCIEFLDDKRESTVNHGSSFSID